MKKLRIKCLFNVDHRSFAKQNLSLWLSCRLEDNKEDFFFKFNFQWNVIGMLKSYRNIPKNIPNISYVSIFWSWNNMMENHCIDL